MTNEYIQKKFLPWHNRTLAVKPKEEESVFVPAGGPDLEGILCVQDDRIVGWYYSEGKPLELHQPKAA
ncbi:hypothetical protein [Methylacidimicrobium tartarophylax]|uniref:Uncharacterized protein n=1 Tax=Methylacidimicrobium tartarophylax TaxID=1041768 RepID=A0A5E6MF74_9BACT|nr:hypothetical protein [Methylacidimicrobium tartarophylax]VVM07766.1 hypothetical protein MAMT_01917 [Methylacidimicrobium tartarophylax]